MSVGIEPQSAALDRDSDLVNEIAPAMKKSVEQQTVVLTRIGFVLIFFGVLFFPDDYASSEAKRIIVDLAGILMGAGILFSPFYAKRIAIAREVRYRRQHGKWRWDH
jgi:hypothetical protein